VKRRVLDTKDSAVWCETLKRFPEADVYFLPQYHHAYEVNGNGTAHAFVAEEGGHLFFYPFIVRPIEKVGAEPVRGPWFDIETVYGYSGPLGTTTDGEFLAAAWKAFDAWCEENRIVAEFIRFNPLLENQCYADASRKPAFDRETVVVGLAGSEEDLWASYPSGHRTKIRKAVKGGLICEETAVADGLPVFKELYAATMGRVSARRSYYFSDSYYDHLCADLGGQVKLFTVRDKERTVAAALFLSYGDRIHYHLGGSDADAREARPNNLLFHAVARWGQERGFRWLHLGGGRGPGQDDELFRFKASLSRLRRSFYIGKRVHNRDAYDALCSQWMRQRGISEPPRFFLLYRLEEDL